MAKSRFLNSSNDRHAAVTDGVFAIAMTILVLEIAVPTISDISSGVALNEYFINFLLPSVLIYFISFYLVYNFWENTVILFSFSKISYGILTLNMLTMAAVCLIPFATGFFFKFYTYTNVNLFFSLLILAISLLYILMFLLLIKNNFKRYFDSKEELESAMHDSYNDGVELPNLKLYLRGITLTLFYLLLAPVISSLLSLLLAFVSPIASVLSFLLTLILVFLIRTRRFAKDNFDGMDLTDDEKEFLGNIRNSIYGE
ncbi:TMEM175 family protein [Methanobrevibacter sp. UBA212]|uniref:TMEM175 family protein n=1 Tax=Methanobrevibacter sp. UBA212 TaxID=1915476 RepID=UPI0025D0A110|nr:TMEM175 family protein [Methanobrevibacter sp. UBA212]